VVLRYHWRVVGLWNDLLLDREAGLWDRVESLVMPFSCRTETGESFFGA
jgi:hypothetical protein